MISCTLTEELVSDGGPIGKPEIVKSKRRPAENEFVSVSLIKIKTCLTLIGKKLKKTHCFIGKANILLFVYVIVSLRGGL